MTIPSSPTPKLNLNTGGGPHSTQPPPLRDPPPPPPQLQLSHLHHNQHNHLCRVTIIIDHLTPIIPKRRFRPPLHQTHILHFSEGSLTLHGGPVPGDPVPIRNLDPQSARQSGRLGLPSAHVHLAGLRRNKLLLRSV
ncbi:unnamed protein product [Ilex paraguariensis]|uniref:Uncharacterized protein n=1 Tax=Ilex paraguariensis TaxID=185542 RepID=A0ABC8UHR6_9AQUA